MTASAEIIWASLSADAQTLLEHIALAGPDLVALLVERRIVQELEKEGLVDAEGVMTALGREVVSRAPETRLPIRWGDES